MNWKKLPIAKVMEKTKKGNKKKEICELEKLPITKVMENTKKGNKNLTIK